MKKFNHNDFIVPNGNYFGFPYEIDESDIVLIPVPWEVTTCFRSGTSKGPESILEVSPKLDFYDFQVPQAWQTKIATHPFPVDIAEINARLRPMAKEVINNLEKGANITDKENVEKLKLINEGSDELNDWLYQLSNSYTQNGKLVGLVGGDHSVPHGFINALSDNYEDFGILQIDAHADLRQAYHGFAYSHASVMYNVSKILSVSSIIQLGLRDICDEEADYARSDTRFHVYDNSNISERRFKGIPWDFTCEEMISKLPQKVYISFDIDGLEPSNCPNTGTPVPGGLTFNEAIYLLRKIIESGKNIIGFDLCEVAPGNDEWDAIVGAKLLYLLSILSVESEKKR